MARPQTHGLVQVLLLGGAVHALVGPLVADVPAGHRVPGDEELGVDVVQVPLDQSELRTHYCWPITAHLEALALEVLAQLDAARHVAEVAEVVADPVVVILLVVVQPNLRQPDRVHAHPRPEFRQSDM